MYEPQCLSGSKLQDDLIHLSLIKPLVVIPNRKYVFIACVPSLSWIGAHQVFPVQPNAQNLYAWKLNSTIVSLEEKYLFIEAEFTGEPGISFDLGEILFLMKHIGTQTELGPQMCDQSTQTPSQLLQTKDGLTFHLTPSPDTILQIAHVNKEIQVQCRSISDPANLIATYPLGVERGYEDLWVSLLENQQKNFKNMVANKCKI